MIKLIPQEWLLSAFASFVGSLVASIFMTYFLLKKIKLGWLKMIVHMLTMLIIIERVLALIGCFMGTVFGVALLIAKDKLAIPCIGIAILSTIVLILSYGVYFVYP